MKVGIITFHFVNNYGGAFQAYALQRAVSEEFSIECELVDYRNQFICFTDLIRLFPVTSNIKEIGAGVRSIGKRLERVRKFHKFIGENCCLSRTYRSYRRLKKNPPNCDKYIAGSGQI